MKSLRWKLLIFFVIFSLLLIFNVFVLADDISSINLGDFTPVYPITKDFYLKLADNDVEKIYICLESDFVDKNSNYIVEADRLNLKKNNLEVNITKNVISVEKKIFYLTMEKLYFILV